MGLDFGKFEKWLRKTGRKVDKASEGTAIRSALDVAVAAKISESTVDSAGDSIGGFARTIYRNRKPILVTGGLAATGIVGYKLLKRVR